MIIALSILLTPFFITGGILWDSLAQARSDRKLKESREVAKLAVDQLRAKRLQRDLGVVEARAQLVANQSVMVELRIEEKRKELGLDRPAGDSPAW